MLTERQKNILSLMVKAHIMSGEPMGSKTISELLENKVSSATIRNEMSFLSEMGFLEQPHTSAGRIPTSKAYRMYVNGLLSNEADEKTKRLIDERLIPCIDFGHLNARDLGVLKTTEDFEKIFISIKNNSQILFVTLGNYFILYDTLNIF